MKKFLIRILLGCLVLVAIGLIAYPYFSYYFAEKNQTIVIQEYEHHMEELDREEKQAAWDMAADYNQNLFATVQEDPFTVSDRSQNEAYSSLLNPRNDGMMGHLKIPKIKVEIPVFHGVSEQVLQIGIGHMEGTSLPVGGEGSHSVLTGHTGLSNSKMFSDLEQLKMGDEFYLYILGEILAYRIDQITVILPHDTEKLKPEYGCDYVTLVTCTPYGVNTHRLLVRGERVPYTPQEIVRKLQQTKSVIGRETMILLAAVSVLVIWLFVNILLTSRRKRNRRRIS